MTDDDQTTLFGEKMGDRGKKSFDVSGATLSRTYDPPTAKEAAAKVQGSVMRRRLLEEVFARTTATAEEAAAALRYTAEDGAWKRVSDLKRLGLIEDTGTTRPGSSGREQSVLRITEAGRKALG